MGRPRVDERQRERARRLGRVLAHAREHQRLSQEQLARTAEVSVDTLRRVEQHRIVTPSFFFIAALTGQLGMSLDELAKATEVD